MSDKARIEGDVPKCELCGDNEVPEVLVVHGRCHMTAPLQATLEGNVLILCCYIPECRREIGRFTVQRIVKS